MRRSRIRRRLILIGVLLIAGIGAASAMIIAMQRTAALQAYEEALVNLGVGMAKQTTQSIATIDLALREIRQATVTMGASSGPMVPPQSSRDMAELLANRRKYLPFVEILARRAGDWL